MDNVISVESKGTAKIVRYRDKQITVLFGDETDEQLALAFEAAVDECVARKDAKLADVQKTLIDLVYKVYQQGRSDGVRGAQTSKSMFDKLLDGIF